MNQDPILRSTYDRGFIRQFFYPVCLTQDFHVSAECSLPEYLCECDTFRTDVLRDRIRWLDENHVKTKMHHDVFAFGEDTLKPIIYRLIIEFARKEDAKAYEARWVNGTLL